ncbi:toprim domain-containing protein [Succinatimonas hippei]|uniref:DnaB-like helicase C-terminal domain-containing protein n=1 Tax=Succinatimonas hippei TaxID=626938 RepID=UPI00201251C2|nr:DnaB-like helicase C-terminal domain-containing protein [Succinatimonas hippei]MCL1603904.1 toprim domain-containing protein [Succinatimonas hippei]
MRTISDRDKQLVKAGLKDFLINRGYLTPSALKAKFLCLNPAHQDEHPSMSYNTAADNVHCFACGATYDIFDLIALENHLDVRTDFAKIYDLACKELGIISASSVKNVTIRQRNSLQPEQIAKSSFEPRVIASSNIETKENSNADAAMYIKQAAWNLTSTDYLVKRGISNEVGQSFGLGFDPAKSQLIIPLDEKTYIARNLDPNKPRYINQSGIKIGLFNSKALEDDDVVFICEGVFDALSFEEIGCKAVAINGVGNYRLIVNYLTNNPDKNFKLCLCFDNDDAGQRAADDLNQALKEADLTNVIIVNSYDRFNRKYKDANEWLVAARDEFSAFAWREKVGFGSQAIAAFKEFDNVTQDLAAFDQAFEESEKQPFFSTGFYTLDKVFAGGLREGLYCIGAVSSLGKTTFTMQIADYIAAKYKQPVFFYSLEMSKNELISKSINRLSNFAQLQQLGAAFDLVKAEELANNDKFHSSLSVQYKLAFNKLNSNLQRSICEKKKIYAEKIAPYFHIREGVGNIGAMQISDEMHRFYKITGQKPIVIIDYLQILAPVDPRFTDKQNADRTVLELKRLSRDLKIPVIAISSFNRSSYSPVSGNSSGFGISMAAFKESGAIEYSADVLIAIQGQAVKDENGKLRYTSPEEVKKSNRGQIRDLEVSILKNRTGFSSFGLKFKYFPKIDFYLPLAEGNEISQYDINEDLSHFWEFINYINF